METLEQVIAKVEELKQALGAEVVVQKEKSVYGKANQPIEESMLGIGANYFNDSGGYVIDLPEITIPDIPKRRSARCELQRIIAQYPEIKSVDELAEATKIKDRIEQVLLEVDGLKNDLANKEKDNSSTKRLNEIYEQDENPVLRHYAGTALGYDKFKIFFHEVQIAEAD